MTIIHQGNIFLSDMYVLHRKNHVIIYHRAKELFSGIHFDIVKAIDPVTKDMCKANSLGTDSGRLSNTCASRVLLSNKLD